MPKICLISEGTYPISIGGVSRWIQSIVSSMPNIDFEIISLTPNKKIKYNYNLPKNIKKIHLWPVWDDDDFNGYVKGKIPEIEQNTKKLKQYFNSEINTFNSSNYIENN